MCELRVEGAAETMTNDQMTNDQWTAQQLIGHSGFVIRHSYFGAASIGLRVSDVPLLLRCRYANKSATSSSVSGSSSPSGIAESLLGLVLSTCLAVNVTRSALGRI